MNLRQLRNTDNDRALALSKACSVLFGRRATGYRAIAGGAIVYLESVGEPPLDPRYIRIHGNIIEAYGVDRLTWGLDIYAISYSEKMLKPREKFIMGGIFIRV